MLKKCMNMKTLLFSLTCLFCCVTVSTSQNVEEVYKADDFRYIPDLNDFIYIDSRTDLSDFPKIVRYKLTIDPQGKNSFANTYRELKKKANKIGRNAFAIDSVGYADNQYIVFVDGYYLNEEAIDENYANYEQNIIVIFGDLNTNNITKLKSCKVNKEKIEIAPYSYVLYNNEVGQKTKISVGGFFGEAVTIVGESNKLGRCFTLGGATVAPEGVGVSIGNRGGGVGVGVSIKTGTVNYMDLSFGLFVMTILDTVKNNL